MDSPTVPSTLANVMAPLREADEYTRLQHIRQRGLYNIVTGLPMAFFVLPTVAQLFLFAYSTITPGDPAQVWKVLVPLLGWTLFILACFPRLFVPLVRRHRPDWQSPLIEANLLKRALEKQFWVQFPFWIAFTSLPFIGLAVAILTDLPGWGWTLLTTGVETVLLVLACTTLAWQARRANDPWLTRFSLAWIPAGLAVAGLDAIDAVPGLLLSAVFVMALVTPSLILGVARMTLPRRWLLR